MGDDNDGNALATEPMVWEEAWYCIRADLYRSTGRADAPTLLRTLLRSSNTRFLVALRVGAWAASTPRRRVARMVCGSLHRRWAVRYGLEIPFVTAVGPGLHIDHRVGGIVVTRRARLGQGVTLSTGVVIGKIPGRSGSPVIGDNVTLSVGAKVIGSVTVGDGVLVGANAVVTRDLPDRVTAAGVPAKVLGSERETHDQRLDFESVLGPPPVAARVSTAEPRDDRRTLPM